MIRNVLECILGSMKAATTAHAKSQQRQAVSGDVVLLLLVVLAGGCLAAILAGLAAFDLQPAPADAWLDATLAWICLVGIAIAFSGVLICGLLAFLAPDRRTDRTSLILSAAPFAALPWRV